MLGHYGAEAVERLETGAKALSMRKLGAEAIRMWLLIGSRLGVMKDIRRLIAEKLAEVAVLRPPDGKSCTSFSVLSS